MTLPAVQALSFLQAEVADPTSEESEVLRELLVPLIGRSAPSSMVISPPSPGTVAVNPETFKARREVFQRLMGFFPKEAKEPSTDLVEVINWYEEGGGVD
jgi:muskelin